MTNATEYVQRIQNNIHQKDTGQVEFLQAIDEFMPSATQFLEKHPEYIKRNILGLLSEPERIIQFRVPWQDDEGNWQVNRGYRIQYNSAIGPYKGGLRFHPSVNLSILKFLAFEQIFKNSLTGLPIGGGKGGSDFDPKGKSDDEIMRFCQSFMLELSKHIGPSIDVPGYGLVYYVKHLLQAEKDSFEGKTVLVSGSGNVAIYAIEKVQELGGKVVTCSDSSGFIYDPEGIDLPLLKEVKEEKRERLTAYAEKRDSAVYHAGQSVWTLKETADIALPCATQNEIDETLANNLVECGVKIIAEGANMPCTLEAVNVFEKANVWYCPGKAANAGGVAVSALEMSQNAQRLSWESEQVDRQLDEIMKNIYQTCRQTAAAYGNEKNLLLGANVAGFEKVAKVMYAQGLV